MKKFSLKTRALSVFLAISLFIVYSPVIKISSETMEDIEARQSEIATENAELQEELEGLQSDEADAQAYSDSLSEKISALETKIDTALTGITELNTSISDLEDKIAEADEEYEDTFELLKTRIRALYETGDVGTLEILLNATSLYDFSMKTETIQAVTQHDKTLCDKITEYVDRTKDDKEALKEQKEELAELKKGLESDQSELQTLYEENEAIIADLQSQEGDIADTIYANEIEDAELQAKYDALIEAQRQREAEAAAAAEAARAAAEEEARREAEANNNNNDNGGSNDTSDIDIYDAPDNSDPEPDPDPGYTEPEPDPQPEPDPTPVYFSCIWPLPGYGYDWITQYFGNYGHGGVDIGAPYGAAIVAACSGTVLSAEYHWSWGNNVFIYHNDEYCTRYAHMSVMAVSAGEYVVQGQVIGYVGSTGNSTGPHLHFEVYDWGNRVDGLAYIG